MRALNLGCGQHVIARPGWVNVDVTPPPGLGSDVYFTRADLEGPLPPSMREADAIVSSHVLEHLEDPEAALRSWHDALRPGGELVVAVPDASRKSEWIGVHLATLDARGDADAEKHRRDFTRGTLLEAVAAAGPWTEVAFCDPLMDWRLPCKGWWQACVRAVR